MVVLVHTYDVHHHPPVHLLDLCRVLRQVSGQREQVRVIDVLSAEVRLQERRRREHVPAFPSGADVEALRREIPSLHQADARDGDTALACGAHIQQLVPSDIVQVVDVPELHYPVRAVLSPYRGLRPGSAGVRAGVVQVRRVSGPLLRQYLQGFLLEGVEQPRPVQLPLGFDTRHHREVRQRTHAGVPDDREPLERRQLLQRGTLAPEHPVQEVQTVPVGKAVLERGEVTVEEFLVPEEQPAAERELRG